MAIGVDIIKTTGRLVFDLKRGEEETTRTIDIPNPITDTTTVQTAVNAANERFTNTAVNMNVFIQPANWRDAGILEEQWVTQGVHYEIVTTTITPVEPDEVVSATMANEEQQQERDERGEQHEQEQNDQQQGQPQGEWQG